jgi:hypothetical protein
MAIKKKVNSAKKRVNKAKRNAKRQTATFKASFKRNAMSDKKAVDTYGSRKSVLGAMTNALAKTTTAGKLGAKAGVAARKTAAKADKMKTKGAAKINSMKTKFGSMKKKGASKIGSMKKSAYKMTASHRAAISRALKGKRR